MDLTHEALKMAGALALVICVLLGGLAWVRRTFGESPGKDGEPLMRVLGGLRVGTGKQIMLLDVAGEHPTIASFVAWWARSPGGAALHQLCLAHIEVTVRVTTSIGIRPPVRTSASLGEDAARHAA